MTVQAELMPELAEFSTAGLVAVQKQPGLRLDKTPDVPLDVIVVDSVDKVPTEN